MSRQSQLPKKVVTREVIIFALVLGLIGFGLLRSSYEMLDSWGTWRDTIREVGTTVIGLGVISLVWELGARRAFMREVLHSVDLAEQIEEAGLQRIVWKYNLEIPWADLFAESDQLDVFVSYARTWRNSNLTNLEGLARKKQGRIRVILPDPFDERTADELARRFNLTIDETRRRIIEAATDYRAIKDRFPGGAIIDCYFVQACPVTTMYIFSDRAVLSLHSHQRVRTDVPTLMVEQGKPLYTFLRAEFDALLSAARPTSTEPPADLNEPQLPEVPDVAQPHAPNTLAG
jgi:hypothetical protein